MRTTVDLAEDVLLSAKERARRERTSVGKVLSDLARVALTGAHETAEVQEPELFYGFRPFPARGVTVTNALVEKLRQEEPD